MGRKRFLALVMALSMLFTLMAPALTFATGTGSEEETPGAGTSEVTEEANEQGSDTDPDEGDGAGNDAGDTNTGADNTGDTGTGDAGADNTGDTGTGDSDTGDVDTGDVDTGDTDTGDTDTGADNTGDTGDTGTGDSDTGDTDTGDVDTGDVDTGADENTNPAQGSDETLPPATVPGDGDGEGDGEGDADKGGDQLPSDGDLGEEEVEKTRGTTEPTTITVAVISFLNKRLGTTGWEVHYWGDGIEGDTSCSLKTPQTIVKHSLGSAYWQGTDKEFLVYSATIPAGATNYNVRNGGEWFGDNGNLADQKGVCIFEYSGNKAEFVESIPFTLGTITVYYSTTWDQPRVHYWFTDGENVDFGGTVMPGETMTHVQGDKFAATIPANVNGLLFNNGSQGNGNQTVDIRNGIENGAFWRPNGNSDADGHLYVELANITVTFDLNGGIYNGSGEDVVVTVQDGDSVAVQAPSPTKESYRFVGWLLEQNSDLFDLGLPLYGDTNNAITLYAQYKQLYTVTAGEVENGTVTADKAQAVEGETVTLTVTPAEGFALKSMTVTGDDGVVPVENNSFIMPASDVTVTATFSPIVAKIDDTGYETLQAAVDAAQAGDTIVLLENVTVSADTNNRFPISKSMTIDGAGHTININNRGFGVGVGASSNIDVTFKDVTIRNNQNDGRCIDTRGNLNSLTLDGVTLKAAAEATQPLTIGGNQADVVPVTITNSTIQTMDDGSYGYAIITFNPVNMTITGSTIKGWACLNIKAASSSAGSNGSTFTITNSALVSKNVYAGESNAFGAIKVEDNNITINISGTSISINGDQNDQAIVSYKNSTLSGAAVNMGAGNNVTMTGDADFAHNNSDTAVLAISGGTFNVEVPAAVCADGYIPKDNGNGTYGVEQGATITFVNYDDTVLETKNVAKEGAVAYTGATTPTKPADASGVYTWTGWDDGTTTYSTTDPLPAAGTADVTYTATFSSVNSVASVTDTNNNVTYYTSLPDAIAAAYAGDTVTLLKDVTLTGTQVIDKNLTLNLGGFVLTAEYVVINGGNVTITNGTVGTVTGDGYFMYVYSTNETTAAAGSYSKLTIASGAVVNGDVVLWGKDGDDHKGYGAQIDLAGKVNGCVFVSGNITEGNDVINVTGEVATDEDVGIALNGYATLNIKDGANIHAQDSVTNATGVEVRAGVLNMTGGAVSGKGEYTVTSNGNGTTSTGAGIAIVQHTTQLAIEATLSAGTVTATDPTKVITVAAVEAGTNMAVVHVTAEESFIANQTEVPNGYKWQETAEGSGTFGLVPFEAVAVIGETKYETLEAAFAAVTDGQTISLLDDVTMTERLFVNVGATPVFGGTNNRYATTSENKAITLDLNGHDITSTSNIALAGGSLNIIGEGMISTSVSGLAPIEIRGTGDLTSKRTLTIGKDVTLQGTCYGLNVFGSNDAQKNVIDVNVNGTVNGMLFVLGNLTNAENEINIVVNGTVDASKATGEEAVHTGIAISGNANVTVNDGATVKGESGIEVRAGSLMVTGGTITATATSFSYAVNGSGTTTKGAAIAVAAYGTTISTTAKLNGGTLEGAKDIVVTDVNGDMSGVSVVSKQSYTESSVIPEGYQWVETETEGMYELKEMPDVAQIGTVKYKTLEAAFAGAAAGDTITILKDFEIDATKTAATDRIVVTKPVTIDFGEYTMTVPGSLEPTANWAALFIDTDTTVKATTGGINCADNGSDPGVYAFNVRNGAKLTIDGGSYHGGGTIAQAQLGTIEVLGGTFTLTPFSAPYNSDFAFNCVDANYTAGTAKIEIKGGTFVGFDPQDNKAEGEHTDFTANGYVAIETSTAGTYVVQPGWNVAFDADGGAPTPDAQRVAAGNTAAEPTAPAKDGFLFGGWFDGTNAATFPYTPAADMTLTAQWTAAVASITKNGTTTYYATLKAAVDAVQDGDTIKLLADVTGEFEVAAGKAVVLDLNGKTITSTGDTLTVKGSLTVNDSSKTEQTAGTGKIIGGWPVNVVGGTLIFNEGIVEAQEMAGWFADGSTVTINGGTFTSADNAVLGTPGNAGRGGNTITINGGTFNGNITTSGYIACGIYAANNDTWNIAGGAFNITGGAGIVVRAGKVNLTGGAITTSGSTTGKVGDAGNAVPCSAIVLDVKAGYPGAAGTDQITIGNATLTTADGVDAIAVLEGDGHSYVDGSITAAGNTLTVPADYKWVAKGTDPETYDLVKVAVSGLKAIGAALALEGRIIIRIGTEPIENSTIEYVTLTINGRTRKVAFNEADINSGNTKLFNMPVYAKEMDDNVVLKAFDANDNQLKILRMENGEWIEVDEYTYSVKRYIANTPANANYKKLVDTMGVYGDYAKYYFQNPHGTTSMPDGYPLTPISASDLNAYAAVTNGSLGNVKYAGGALALEDGTYIRVFFTGDVDGYTFSCNGVELEPVAYSSYHYVTIDNIAAKELDTVYTVEVTDGTNTYSVRYSALTYVRSVLSNNSNPQTLKDVVTALYWYNQEANEYFPNNN